MKVRNKQCKACPWKKNVVPIKDIPNAYCELKHARLANTIATPGDLTGLNTNTLHIMACHEHDSDEGVPCVGWLYNQLGPGNNIVLRVLAIEGKFAKIKVVGKQHETFEDTLINNRKFTE